MPRIGDFLSPEVGRTDYAPFLQGSQQGSAALGQGISAFGAGAGDLFKQIGDAKKKRAGFEKFLDSAKQMVPEGSKYYTMLEGLQHQVAEAPLSQAVGIAEQGSKMLQFMGDQLDRDLAKQSIFFDQDYKNRALDQGASEFFATHGLDIAKFNAMTDVEKRDYALRERDFGLREQAQGVELPLKERAQTLDEIQADEAAATNEERTRILKEQNEIERMKIESALGKPVEIDGQVYQLPKELSELQKTEEREIGKIVAEWKGAGKQRTTENLKKLKEVRDQIASGKISTGPVISILHERFRSKTLHARQQVRSVGYQSLTDTLGAQFAEKEGERLLSTYFDDRLPEKYNVKKLDDFIGFLETKSAGLDKLAAGGVSSPAGPKEKSDDEVMKDLERWLNDREAQRPPPVDYGGVLPPKNNPIPMPR